MPDENELAETTSQPPPDVGITKDWITPAALPAMENRAGATITRDPEPTPGPGHPHRATLSDDTERMPDADSHQGLPQIPGFRVEKVLGRGGMGVVYRAVHLELNKVVALKVIYPRGRDEHYVRGRFEREVQSLAEIEHPNVVPIYHAGNWLGFPYFTMKLIPGGPLSQHLRRFAGDFRASGRVMSKVARAIQALHDAKIIHRDLKPLNILLADDDEPMVADFGLAKWLDEPGSDFTGTGVPIGTRQYMAPEQTLGQKASYSEACDIWALGVTLYELLAGRRPFADDGTAELAEQIRSHEAPPLPDDVPAGLTAIAAKCMAKEPADRYATAVAVADELDRWLAGEPVSAPPPPPPRRPRSRNWAIAGGIVALLALIAAPAALIPPRSSGGVTERAAPPIPTLTARLVAGETVFLTDAKGKPLGPTTAPARPDFDLLTGEDSNGFHYFSALRPGLVQLSNEPLPLPVVLEAEIAVPFGTVDQVSCGGIFVVGRQWLGGKVVHHSIVRCVISPEFTADRERVVASAVELYRWTDDRALGPLRFLPPQRKPWGFDPDKEKQPRFVPVRVTIHPHELTVTLDGNRFAPVTAQEMLTKLRTTAADDPRLAGYPYTPPAFGDSVGVCLNHSTVIVKDLRITRVVP